MDESDNEIVLSVIIPVYNSSHFIKRCIQSVINQSFKNIELIIVDDNSTDNTIAIVQEIIPSHPNADIVRTTGGNGAGGARNIGIKKAKGSYISFVDSDDWIDSMMFEKMINVISKNNAEIAICGVMTEFDNYRLAQIRYKYELENIIDGDFALELLSRNTNQDISISPVVWNKIYSSSFLLENEIEFISNSYNEDDAFTFTCFLNAKKIVLTPNTYYHYFQRESSNTHSFSKKHIIDLVKAFSHIKNYMEKRNIFETYNMNYYSFFEKCLAFVINNLLEQEKDKKLQLKYVKLLFEMIDQVFQKGEYLEYVGFQRIYDFITPYKIK